METPIEIDFQGMAAKSSVRDSIIKHVSQLEERFGRIVAGRVVLKAPGGHHQTGGLYEIKIRLTLPEGREVVIDHTAQNDERYSDLNFPSTTPSSAHAGGYRIRFVNCKGR